MRVTLSYLGLFHFIFIASIKSYQEIGWWRETQEKFEDTKEIIRNSKSKRDRQMAKRKMTNIDLEN